MIRECQWKMQIKTLSKDRINTDIGRILYYDNQKSLLDAIRHENVFGFVEIDIDTPQAIREEWGSFLFPPIIRKMDIDESMISSFMMEQIIENNRKSRFNSVFQTYSGKKLFLMTSLVKFYME